ncbi:MAG: NfeD family protein [Verrucomicrobiota bacterium]
MRFASLLLFALCLFLQGSLTADDSGPLEEPAEALQAEGPQGAEATDPIMDTAAEAESSEAAEVSYPKPALVEIDAEGGVVDVYVVPIEGPISKPNLFILRRALKEAITNDVEMVILDMDTPGGRVDICLEMMEMLDRFDGVTATYVNEDAISAGSFIAAATDEIYFSPRGKIGASAVIQGTGEDVPETARLKIESYLRANIRVISEADPLRGKVIRAMLDSDFELKVGDELIKKEGELLTLTAKEAITDYGNPPRPLLGEGIHETIDDLLATRLGEQGYLIKDFKVTYSEQLAKWLDTFVPALMGLGVLLLFIEFKTPGFGIFGILGITVLAIFFISQYVAGLSGNEVIVFFAIGVVLVLVELIFFPGSIIFAVTGLALMLGSLLWAMVDIWPKGDDAPKDISFNPDILVEPMMNLIFGLSIAVFGMIVLSRFLKGSWMERQIVLADAVGGGRLVEPEAEAGCSVLIGRTGTVVAPLHPSGRIEIDGQRYTATCQVGTVEKGASVCVLSDGDFGLIVEEVDL